MHLRISTSLLVCLLILGFVSSAMVEGFGNGATRLYLLDKDGVWMKINRKLLMLDAVLDYDYAGPNPKHDPRGKKPAQKSKFVKDFGLGKYAYQVNLRNDGTEDHTNGKYYTS